MRASDPRTSWRRLWISWSPSRSLPRRTAEAHARRHDSGAPNVDSREAVYVVLAKKELLRGRMTCIASDAGARPRLLDLDIAISYGGGNDAFLVRSSIQPSEDSAAPARAGSGLPLAYDRKPRLTASSSCPPTYATRPPARTSFPCSNSSRGRQQTIRVREAAAGELPARRQAGFWARYSARQFRVGGAQRV